MAIIKQKKEKSIETPLDKIIRKRKEKEAKAVQDAKDKEAARITEEKRLEKLVVPHLNKLEKQIVEKGFKSFWTFPDEPGFKKFKDKSLKEMQAIVNKDVAKYKNRNIAKVTISFYHQDKPSNVMRRNAGFWFAIDITIFPIDKNGVLNGADNAWGADVGWRLEDFKITKFSLKLLQAILKPVGRHLREFTSFLGVPAERVLKELKRAGVNFDDVLAPLPKAIK